MMISDQHDFSLASATALQGLLQMFDTITQNKSTTLVERKKEHTSIQNVWKVIVRVGKFGKSGKNKK